MWLAGATWVSVHHGGGGGDWLTPSMPGWWSLLMGQRMRERKTAEGAKRQIPGTRGDAVMRTRDMKKQVQTAQRKGKLKIPGVTIYPAISQIPKFQSDSATGNKHLILRRHPTPSF